MRITEGGYRSYHFFFFFFILEIRSGLFIYLPFVLCNRILFYFILFLFVVDFVIHWNETAMGLHEHISCSQDWALSRFKFNLTLFLMPKWKLREVKHFPQEVRVQCLSEAYSIALTTVLDFPQGKQLVCDYWWTPQSFISYIPQLLYFYNYHYSFYYYES